MTECGRNYRQSVIGTPKNKNPVFQILVLYHPNKNPESKSDNSFKNTLRSSPSTTLTVQTLQTQQRKLENKGNIKKIKKEKKRNSSCTIRKLQSSVTKLEGKYHRVYGNEVSGIFFLLWNQVLDRTCDATNRSSISKSTKGVSQTIHTGKVIKIGAGEGKFEACRKTGGTHRHQRGIYR